MGGNKISKSSFDAMKICRWYLRSVDHPLLKVKCTPNKSELASAVEAALGLEILIGKDKRIIACREEIVSRGLLDDAKEAGRAAYAKRRESKKLFAAKNSNFVATDAFLSSYEWRKLRYEALATNDGCCELCGQSKADGRVLHVDHIKPRRKYPELALDLNNLQVLCEECNHGKGNWDETDWRKRV